MLINEIMETMLIIEIMAIIERSKSLYSLKCLNHL